jgi:hypothetical protein
MAVIATYMHASSFINLIGKEKTIVTGRISLHVIQSVVGSRSSQTESKFHPACDGYCREVARFRSSKYHPDNREPAGA